MRIPEWIVDGLTQRKKNKHLLHFLSDRGIVTICEEAQCPNIGTCFDRKTATFLIMGSTCMRNCAFCAVTSGEPESLDEREPEQIAEAVEMLGIRHAVITSVTRDDLEDKGAGHFISTIRSIREKNSGVTIEVLVPDFDGSTAAIDRIIDEKPDVINHNIETAKDLYTEVRPEADYHRSLALLARVAHKGNTIVSKSGMMVGLGETAEQVYETMDDLLGSGVQLFTIGQYLRPTTRHHDVKRYVPPDEFEKYREVALKKGFIGVASGPFIRSSFGAESLYRDAKRRIGETENRRNGESGTTRMKDKG